VNQKEYFEAILTEAQNLVHVSTAVSSGMIEWRAQLPAALQHASYDATVVALVPLPGASIVSRGVTFTLTTYNKLKQQFHFEKLAKLSSVTMQFDRLLALLALDWCDRNAQVVKDLPKWNSESSQELREDLYCVWCSICARVKQGTTRFVDSIRAACDDVTREVGLRGAKDGNLVKTSRPSKQFSESAIRDEVTELYKKGKLFLFGGEDVGLKAMERRLVTGKPLSPATILGKVHAREILHLLLQDEVCETVKKEGAVTEDVNELYDNISVLLQSLLLKSDGTQTKAIPMPNAAFSTESFGRQSDAAESTNDPGGQEIENDSPQNEASTGDCCLLL